MAELWCPFAVRRDGPHIKTGYASGQIAPKRGEVKHSAEGYWPGIYSALDSLEQDAQGYYKHGSWHFTVGFDRVEQHFAVNVNCWHGGDTDDDGAVRANIDLVGMEHLGMAGTPLTPYQVEMTARLSVWSAEQFGRSRFRRFDGWDPDEPGLWLLAEHTQVSNTYTACPSNRIPWGLVQLKITELTEEEDMKPYLIAEAGAPYVYITDGVILTYLRNMAHADALGIPREVKVVPAGTLASVARLDNIAATATYTITGSARPG